MAVAGADRSEAGLDGTLGKRRLTMAMLSPVVPPKKKACYRYECYRAAWTLFTKSRAELRCYHN